MVSKYVYLFLVVYSVTVPPSDSAPQIRCITKGSTGLTMDCSSLNLTDLQTSSFSKHVHNLTLSGNRIVTPKLANWPDLRYLDLSNNSIANLSGNPFNSLKHLEHLNVSHNQLETVYWETFANLTTLKVLDLSFNPLTGDATSTWDSIKTVLANGLEELYLSSVSLREIPEEVFLFSTSLRVLDLSRNEIKTLPAFPETTLRLDLGFNSLEKVSAPPFELCSRLEYLSLDNNTLLTTIDEGAFGSLVNLGTLSLKGCKSLARLPDGLLKNNTEMKNLSLAGCNLKTLPQDMKPLLLRMDSVEIHANPWACNYSMKWFTKLNTPPTTMAQLRCGTPVNVTVAEFMEPTLSQQVVRYCLIIVSGIGVCGLLMSMWVGCGMERKRREEQHHNKDEKDPLYSEMPPQHPDAVYISTVIKK